MTQIYPERGKELMQMLPDRLRRISLLSAITSDVSNYR